MHENPMSKLGTPLHNLLQFFSSSQQLPSTKEYCNFCHGLHIFNILLQWVHVPDPSSMNQTSLTHLSNRVLISTLRDLPESRYAFATLLTAPEKESDNKDDDRYFIATRMPAYQLYGGHC